MTIPRIVAAALNIDGLIITLPPPARHHDLIRLYNRAYDLQVGPSEQGFLTSEGKFADRREAVRIAIDAGQVETPAFPPNLHSEDLW